MRHILAIDDDPQVRLLIARVLETAGYVVSTAASVREAIASATAHERRIDLLITDILMPDADSTPFVPFVATTCISPRWRVGRCTSRGGVLPGPGTRVQGDRHAAKPLTAEALLMAVRNLLSEDPPPIAAA
jgi:two-component system OmpR family response regulator